MPDSSETPLNNTAAARRREIGGLVRRARELAGRKPKELANFAAISVITLNAIESGEKEPTLPQLESMAYSLHLPVGALLGFSELAPEKKSPNNLAEIIRLRGHIIGARLKQVRMMRNENAAECAAAIGVATATLQAWEIARKQPSITELEALLAHFGMTFYDMLDIGIGPLGQAQMLLAQRTRFESLSAELRTFVCDPASMNALHLAERLRNLPSEQMALLASAFDILAAEAAAAAATKAAADAE
ncbi:MAG: helix-turn-helix transcriptional regulator [Chloroflexi bacterium]|nr:helix-turn-helix transcriptional regulator [Chloroflexota bacterium]